jgi:hypothetical protein
MPFPDREQEQLLGRPGVLLSQRMGSSPPSCVEDNDRPLGSCQRSSAEAGHDSVLFVAMIDIGAP